MKAIIQFFSTGSGTATLSASKVIEGKDLRIHFDGPSAYHLTDAYHNHKLIGAYSGVESIELEGKPKQRKPKPAETLTIEVDTSKLQMCIKEAMLELEGLANKDQFIHKEDIDDDYLNRNCPTTVLAEYGILAARMERDQLQKELDELRLQVEGLAFVPPDVATAVQLLNAELLVYVDHVKNGQLVGLDPNQDIHFGNGIRFAIGKLTGNPIPFAQVPFNPPAPIHATSAKLQNKESGEVLLSAGEAVISDTKLVDALSAPLPSAPAKLPDCTCPPKRNIIDLGHLSYCPNSPHYNAEEGELPQPHKE